MATLIKERYEILELLAIGGEGRVVKALDRRYDRLVTLRIRPVSDDQAREELLSKARILLAVPPHPALPVVREVFFDGDDYVLAVGWVDGRPWPRCYASGASRGWRPRASWPNYRRPPRHSRICTRRFRRSSTAM